MNTNKKILLTIMTTAFAAVWLCANGCGESGQESSPEPAASQMTQKESGPGTEKIVATDKPTPTKIEWVHSVSEGLLLAKATGKPVLIDFFADWCGPCQQMDKNTFPEKRVIEELARFVAIKGDVSRPSSKGQAAAKEYGVQAIPTYIFIDTQGKQTKHVGYRPPDTFLRILKGIK